MNEQASWDEYVNRIDDLIASGKYVSRADAGDAVRRRYPHLANVKYPGTGLGHASPTRSVSAGAGSAEAQLNALAKRIAAERHISFAQAYVQALNSDASLYLRYLQEHEAALGARHG